MLTLFDINIEKQCAKIQYVYISHIFNYIYGLLFQNLLTVPAILYSNKSL